MKTTFSYDHYYKYDEIKEHLEYFAFKYPNLVSLDANCKTAKGKIQFAVTLTNKETGDAVNKPALYIDGNIHAGEVTSSMCAMHTIDYLLTNYGKDEECTKLLDGMTFYVIPRVSPDGAEAYLSSDLDLRSVDIEYLSSQGGVEALDIDGDSVVRMMKIKTPYGAWKADKDNPSLFSLREPDDTEGEFFDLFTEGNLNEYEGSENLKEEKSKYNLDFNRNFPMGWNPEYRQPGAGPYPLSNPECKALCDFILAHPNIGGALIGHTTGGVILYPPGTRASDTISDFDLTAFKEIANMGKAELDYEPVSIFDSFIKSQDYYDSGALDDWCYQSQGIPAYTMEFWDLKKKAGVPKDWSDKSPKGRNEITKLYAACMNWVKENAPEYYKDWEEYDHPQLGKVEIAGFNTKKTYENPPESYLTAECEHDTKFNLRFAKAMPKLAIEKCEIEELGNDMYKLEVTVGNKGYLPSYLTDEAIKLGLDKPVTVSISGCSFVTGKETEEAGNLEGYSRTLTGLWFNGNITTKKAALAKKKLSWIVKVEKGTAITITAVSEKAGCAKAELTI